MNFHLFRKLSQIILFRFVKASKSYFSIGSGIRRSDINHAWHRLFISSEADISISQIIRTLRWPCGVMALISHWKYLKCARVINQWLLSACSEFRQTSVLPTSSCLNWTVPPPLGLARIAGSCFVDCFFSLFKMSLFCFVCFDSASDSRVLKNFRNNSFVLKFFKIFNFEVMKIFSTDYKEIKTFVCSWYRDKV